MSKYNINSNPALVNSIINNAKNSYKDYYRGHPDSVIPQFERELREMGFRFEITDQIRGFMPKHKETILPIAIRYYQQAREYEKPFFLNFFRFKGCDIVVPMLLKDYRNKEVSDSTRWFIADCLFQICSKDHSKEYVDIVSDASYGQNRQMLILLLGKLKDENAIPVLIELLEDEGVRLHAISALGEYRKEELRKYFERFQNSTHPGWKKYSRIALKKLETQRNDDMS